MICRFSKYVVASTVYVKCIRILENNYLYLESIYIKFGTFFKSVIQFYVNYSCQSV